MDLEKTYKDKKILITGGMGFLGSSLAHSLVGYGGKVTVLDAMLPLYGGNRFNLHGIEDMVEVINGDVRDYNLIKTIVPGKDFIFNFAGQVSYIDSGDIPYEDLDINSRAHLMILEECRHNNPEAKILYASSRMALGKITQNPVTESHPANPLSLYGVHKLTGEKYSLAYHHHYGLRTVAMRITNPYGIRQQMKHNKYSLVGWFIRLAMENREIKIFGNGDQKRDYIYVDDLVESFLRAGATGETDGELFNLGLGRSTAFCEMVHTVVETVGQGKIDYVPWPDDYERIETGDFVVDVSKLNNLIKWKPNISLSKGILTTYDYYRKYAKHYWQ